MQKPKNKAARHRKDAAGLQMTEQQTAQQALFMEGLVHFLDIAGRIQDFVARGLSKGKLEAIHLAFLRRASIHGFVSFDRVRADTSMPRYAVSRAAALLEREGLGDVSGLESDKRFRRFVINDAGQKLIGRIEWEIARNMAREIRVLGPESKRYFLFTVHLSNLTRFLPDSPALSRFSPSDVGFHETIGPDETDIRRVMVELAARPGLTMASPERSILTWF